MTSSSVADLQVTVTLIDPSGVARASLAVMLQGASAPVGVTKPTIS